MHSNVIVNVKSVQITTEQVAYNIKILRPKTKSTRQFQKKSNYAWLVPLEAGMFDPNISFLEESWFMFQLLSLFPSRSRSCLCLRYCRDGHLNVSLLQTLKYENSCNTYHWNTSLLQAK
jgi:hypothetical protein